MNSKINVIKEYSKEERMTREGGEKLREQILSASKNHAVVELNFSKTPVASVSFWDESLAKLLLEGWTIKDIQNKIKLVDVHPRDVEILDKLIQARKATK